MQCERGNVMIDIHCHILPGADHGPMGTENAVRMLSEAQKAGVKAIIATPHYSQELHENGLAEQVFSSLRNEAKRYGIELYRGYEIKIHHYRARMPSDYSDLDLSGSKYLLLELPFDRAPSYTINFIYQLQLEGYTIIIAHPERCRKLAHDWKFFIELYEMGCLMQLDAASIIGMNGRGAKWFARRIIKSKKAAFVASDAHNIEGYTQWYVKAYAKVQKWTDKEYVDELFFRNGEEILECIASNNKNTVAVASEI